MPAPISSITAAPSGIASGGPAASGETALRQQFDAAVAGTFYRQMMQSLRKMHDKPAYFHGGQAEEMFRNQLDQQVADDLAARHGQAFSEPLFEAFAARLRAHALRSDQSV
ncbi:MAG: rod-binding protein [Planctomycetales bacterium]